VKLAINIQNSVYAVALLVMLAVLLNVIPKTSGRFLQTLKKDDSALAAVFNVEITAPKELTEVSDEDYYQYYFLQEGEIKVFDFKVTNNGEAVVTCFPHINGGIMYQVFVSGKAQNEFAVLYGETVEFQLVVMSDGLTANLKEVSFFVDIEQSQGG